ncbi:MAG TPA: regulatory protein RecX [Mycobacteriales bacterium]
MPPLNGRLRLLPPPGPPTEPPDDAARPAEPDADPESVARAICLRLLTNRPCTRAELAKELRRRNVPADAADAVLARFDDVGLIDDRAFAAAYVERRQRRGLSRRALAEELRRKGVASEEAAEAVSVVSDDDERALATALVQRRLGSVRALPYDKAVARLVGMLARKGYGSGLAYAVVREALSGAGAGSDEDADGSL